MSSNSQKKKQKTVKLKQKDKNCIGFAKIFQEPSNIPVCSLDQNN